MGTDQNTAMSAFLLGARRSQRGRAEGLLERLRGATPLDDDRQERLNVQMAAFEEASRRGDSVGVGLADERISVLLDEARAERQAATPPEPRSGFDGGVRASVGRTKPVDMNGQIRRVVADREALRQHARESAG